SDGIGIPELSPSTRAEIFSHSNHVIAAVWAVRAEVGRAQITIARSQSFKKKMLSSANLKTLPQVNSYSPGTFDSDCVERIGVEILGDIFSKKQLGFAENHEAAENSLAEW